MIIKLEPDFKHADERGIICQVLSIPTSQVNYLFTKKGAKRGSHYHKENKEFFYIIDGEIALFAYPINAPPQKEKYIFKTGDLFMVEPLTVHYFEFTENTQMIVMYDKGVDHEGKKDIFII